MSKLGQTIVLIGVVMGLSLGIPWPSQAAIVKLSVGVSQSNTIWQTSPQAFAKVTRWAGIGLSVLIDRVSLGFGTTIVDFQTMKIKYPPSFSLSAGVGIARLFDVLLTAGGSVVITPSDNWIGWSLGVGLTRPLIGDVEASSGVGIETTRGAPGYSPGTNIHVYFGVSWSWRLL